MDTPSNCRTVVPERPADSLVAWLAVDAADADAAVDGGDDAVAVAVADDAGAEQGFVYERVHMHPNIFEKSAERLLQHQQENLYVKQL